MKAETQFPKICTCCFKAISREEWETLSFVGFQSDGEGGTLELRNCADCCSTLAIDVSSGRVAA